MRTRAYKYTSMYTHAVRVPEELCLSLALALIISPSLPRASLGRHTSIVSRRGNLNEIRSVEEAVEDSARIRSGAGSETARLPRLSALAISGNSILRGLIEKQASLTQTLTATGFPKIIYVTW